jgi:hypothetical protein
MDLRKTFTDMGERWPSSIIAREEAARFTGGAVSARYLANLDSLGKGPKERLRIGRKVAYPVASFIQWLNERSIPLKHRERTDHQE